MWIKVLDAPVSSFHIFLQSCSLAVHALVALHGYVMDPTAQGHEKYSGKGIWVAFAARPARGRNPRLDGTEDPASYYSGYPSEPQPFNNMTAA